MTTIQLPTLKAGLLWCFLGLCSVAQAQAVDEYVSVDSLKVGDTLDYSITLDYNQPYEEIHFPDSTAFGEPFEIRVRKQFKVSATKDSVYYRLQFFGTADTVIPPLPVVVVQNQDSTVFYTNPVPVYFNSVLAEDEPSFRPLKPIFEFAGAWWPYLLGLILLGIALYFLYRYYTQNPGQVEPAEPVPFKPEPFKNPLLELRKTIEKLEQMELAGAADFKEFYIELGDAIRRYFETLYKIPALESTSRELLDMLRKRMIDESLISDTRAVLYEADKVKFAKFTPTIEQADGALQKAHRFLERAREVDGPRLDHLRREYHTKMEAARSRHEAEQAEADS